MEEVRPEPINRHRVGGGMIVFPVTAFHLPSLPSFRVGYNMGVNLIGMASAFNPLVQGDTRCARRAKWMD